MSRSVIVSGNQLIEIIDTRLTNILRQSNRQLGDRSERLNLARMLFGQRPHATDDVVSSAGVVHGALLQLAHPMYFSTTPAVADAPR
jgi:hypothetical protein